VSCKHNTLLLPDTWAVASNMQSTAINDCNQHDAAHHDGHSAYSSSAQQLRSKAANPTQPYQQHIQRCQLVEPLLTNQQARPLQPIIVYWKMRLLLLLMLLLQWS
jgi:hypothetical protein